LDRGFDRLLNLLECFLHKEVYELTQSELAQMMGLSKATTYRLAEKLEQRGYLIRNPDNRCYRIGPKVLPLGQKFLGKLDYINVALPYMEKLRDEVDETVSLFIAAKENRICVARVRSTQPLQQIVSVGDELPLDRGSSGRVLRAFAPETVGTSQEDLDQLKQTQRLGYAVSHGERTEGVSAISVPVKNHRGKSIAALTISGPTFRYTEERLPRYIEVVRQTADKISRELGHQA